METESQVSQLEQALLRQAETLAREQHKNAEATRMRIRAELDEKLSLREEKEVLAAKGEAERLVRRRIQAAETHLAAELDRLRWALTESVQAQVRIAYQDLVQDWPRYREALMAMVRAASEQLPPGDLVVEVTARDFNRLHPEWAALAAGLGSGRQLELVSLTRESEGGARVRLVDSRAQVDQTFEARQERLAEDLARIVMERLFASTPDLGTLVHG